MSSTAPRIEVMKRIVVSLIVLLLAAGWLGQAGAATVKKKRVHVGQTGQSREPHSDPLAANGYAGYNEQVLDKVPFGSQLWWRVYDSQPKGR